MKCAVCAAGPVRSLGSYRPYTDFTTTIYACDNCGCRFAPRQAQAHEALHSASGSSYAPHRQDALEMRDLIQAHRLAEARKKLARQTKFAFILDQIEARGRPLRILEMGCSAGSLTAYLNSAGHRAIGVDVSRSSIAFARECFGDHYYHTSASEVASGGPYDVICHAGTIGCVDDPMEFTAALLAMLGEEGQLLFNAPNLGFAEAANLPWLVTTPPPDLVTLFPTDFWSHFFADESREVTTTVHHMSAGQFTKLRMTPGTWVRGRRRLLEHPGRVAALAYRGAFLMAAGLAAIASRLGKPQSDYPAEYGVMVCIAMRDRAATAASPC